MMSGEARNRVTALLADDSPVVRRGLTTLLENVADLEIVGQADNPARLLDAVRDLKPAVVILDPHLSHDRGLAVLPQLKRDGVGPVVIAYSDFVYPAGRARCLHAGADFLFDKVSEYEAMVEVLKTLTCRAVGDGRLNPRPAVPRATDV